VWLAFSSKPAYCQRTILAKGFGYSLRAWAFNLKNARNHPAYEFDRAYYLMMYAQ
jgi:hypothetical protein